MLARRKNSARFFPTLRPSVEAFRPFFETLERRCLLTAVPYGAAADDTAEFMLGDVVVSVVLLESDGSEDENLENWTTSQIDEIKGRVREGLQWWEDLLEQQNSSHWLNFTIDFKYADDPIDTGYEAISRPSDDFVHWINDFFAEAEIPSGTSFSNRIRQFNHEQRLMHEANWAFTIFIVNAENDVDGRFDSEGTFSRAFAFAGGRFFVTTSERPASTIAHETAHMFWALDEYADSASYSDHRGYYDTQNVNAIDGHPDATQRVRSIMDSHGISFALHAASPSSLEMIGWRDSDQDGIFDVMDVPHRLDGVGVFDAGLSRYAFTGSTAVDTLPNQNPIGNGHAITLNEISRVEVRFDQGPWQTVEQIGAYQADLDFEVIVPTDATEIEIRSVDDRTGISSPIYVDPIERPAFSWQNRQRPNDVNGDQLVTPLDALLVINKLNVVGPHSLVDVPEPAIPQYLDVNGDLFVSAIDALLVINELNEGSQAGLVAANPGHGNSSEVGEGEPDGVAAAIASRRASLSPPDVNRNRKEHSPTRIRSARCIDLALVQLTHDAMLPLALHSGSFDPVVEDMELSLTGTGGSETDDNH